MAKEVKVYDQNDEIVAVFISVKREGDELVVDGKALGTMRMNMFFTLEEIFHALRMALCWAVISFILLLPYFTLRHLYRRSRKRLSQK